MNLFYEIINGIKNIIGDIVGTKITNKVSDSLTDQYCKDSFDLENFTFPERYNNFPKYSGKLLCKPIENETDKYYRISARYQGTPSDEFLTNIIQNNFIKGSPVRYDKDNTYIIVEYFPDNHFTKIAYHIKK